MTKTHTQGSNLICIRSRDLKNKTSTGSGGRMVLHEAIQAAGNEKLYVCLFSAIFPNSWHNLSPELKNNTISFKETGDSDFKTVALDTGSYDINELMTEIKNKLNANSTNNLTYSLTYNTIKNSVSITHNNTANIASTFDFSDESSLTSCRRMIGFLADVPQIINVETATITSNRSVDITDTYNSVYVRLPNLSNNKVIESSSSKYSNIVAHIPVPLSRNSIFTYEPSNKFCMELTQKQISAIDINITFQNEEYEVNFNNADWEVNLMIEYRLDDIKRLHTYNNTIHKSIQQQMRRYERKLITDQEHYDELKEIVQKSNKNLGK